MLDPQDPRDLQEDLVLVFILLIVFCFIYVCANIQ